MEKEDKDKEDIVSFVKNRRRYYTKRIEAENVRKKGQTIKFSSKYKAYYIINVKKRSFWGL